MLHVDGNSVGASQLKETSHLHPRRTVRTSEADRILKESSISEDSIRARGEGVPSALVDGSKACDTARIAWSLREWVFVRNDGGCLVERDTVGGWLARRLVSG